MQRLLIQLLLKWCSWFQVLLEFLQRVIDHRDKNKMNLKNVAMVMAPNLFMFHGLGAKPTEQSEFVMAAGTANVMRFMIKYQNLLWTVSLLLLKSECYPKRIVIGAVGRNFSFLETTQFFLKCYKCCINNMWVWGKRCLILLIYIKTKWTSIQI